METIFINLIFRFSITENLNHFTNFTSILGLSTLIFKFFKTNKNFKIHIELILS